MAREIGSEFESMPYTARGTDVSSLFPGADVLYTFCGRGALETVLKNAGTRRKAALPSWCCDSMIEPFRKAGIGVCFYPVGYDDGLTVDYSGVPADCDILLSMRYFGFASPEPPEALAGQLHKNGCLLIEDCTHSLLSGEPCRPWNDCAIVSLRKWFPLVSGGMAVSRRGGFQTELAAPPEEYIRLRLGAMDDKRTYLETGKGDKQSFLARYAEANERLREGYPGLGIDSVSEKILAGTDTETVRQRRIQNAHILYKGLKDCSAVRFLFPEEAIDCPLFVPVLLEKEKRDALRQALIKEAVYCPGHWPRPKSCESVLYERELSLICDQRYTEEDMFRIVEIIIKATGKGNEA